MSTLNNYIKFITDSGEFLLPSTDTSVLTSSGHYLPVVNVRPGMTVKVSNRYSEVPTDGSTMITVLDIQPHENSNPNQSKEVPMDNTTQQIQDMHTRISALEETLATTNETLLALQKSIVQVTADHMQRIFNDDVMIDSIAHRVMVAGANAISYKAKSSKERAPELVVVEGYVPGAVRVTIQEDGAMVEEQEAEGQTWVSGDDMSEGMRSPEIQKVFADLVLSYGGELNRAYYVVDSVQLEEFRKNTAAAAKDVLTNVKTTGGIEDQVAH